MYKFRIEIKNDKQQQTATTQLQYPDFGYGHI